MRSPSLRLYEIRARWLPGDPLVGRLAVPLSTGPRSGTLQDPGASPAQAARAAAVMRFQYDGDWVESGVPLGADLPLEHGVLRPRLGKSAFGFLEDRAISAPVFSIFNDPAAPLSGLPEGAGRLETTALLLPHRTDSLGALSVTPVDVDPLPERPRVKRQSELPELIYAYHAMERGKAGSDEVSLLQNGLTLPGRRPVFTVERHREAQTARLRSMLDPIDRPLWMHMALVAAKRCGIRTVETDLEHEMGENILFTRRADRRGANADAPADKPLLTLTGGAGDSLNRWQFHREPLGWRLSPAHTLEWNPSAQGRGLTMDGRRRLSCADDAIPYARYFGLTVSDAKGILMEMRRILSGWEGLAEEFGADPRDIAYMAPLFEENL